MGMDGLMRFRLAGFDVHRVGFGAMQLPGPGVFGPPKDRDQALAVLHTAREPDEAMAAVGDTSMWRDMVEAAIAQKVD